MPHIKIVRAAAKAKQPPREFMLARLRSLGSQTALSRELLMAPVMIRRAMAELRIVELKVYTLTGSNYAVRRLWMYREDVLTRDDWHELA